MQVGKEFYEEETKQNETGDMEEEENVQKLEEEGQNSGREG